MGDRRPHQRQEVDCRSREIPSASVSQWQHSVTTLTNDLGTSLRNEKPLDGPRRCDGGGAVDVRSACNRPALPECMSGAVPNHCGLRCFAYGLVLQPIGFGQARRFKRGAKSAPPALQTAIRRGDGDLSKCMFWL